MGKTAILTVRLPEAAKDGLAALARSTRRSANFLAAEAIVEYVAANAWQVEETRKAAEKADAGGPFVRHEDAVRYIDALARGEDPAPPPTFGPADHGGRGRPLARGRARGRARDLPSHRRRQPAGRGARGPPHPPSGRRPRRLGDGDDRAAGPAPASC